MLGCLCLNIPSHLQKDLADSHELQGLRLTPVPHLEDRSLGGMFPVTSTVNPHVHWEPNTHHKGLPEKVFPVEVLARKARLHFIEDPNTSLYKGCHIHIGTISVVLFDIRDQVPHQGQQIGCLRIILNNF